VAFHIHALARFLRGCESGHAPCKEVLASAENILIRVDRQIKELKATQRIIRETLADWDFRLGVTPSGKPACARRLALGTSVIVHYHKQSEAPEQVKAEIAEL
jgi:hypothetical protein